MSLTIKICGLSTPETLDAALAAGADMVGFVFFPKSSRHISFDTATMLARHMDDKALKVALTVDADDATIGSIIASLKPKMLQLHGAETPERVADVRAKFGLPVMKALGLAQPEDLSAIARFEPVSDWLLFDAKPVEDTSLPGGNGQAFNWDLLRCLKTTRPWLLAGGLTADNIAAALTTTHAPGVDVSSGVESAPGVKDTAKIRAFIANAHRPIEALGSTSQSG
jgi:phosphoribosylanthranilate isomerase